MNSPIFIIGFMASGKTTLGRALARRLGREFIDLDFYISQRFRRSIGELFAERGEEGFRTLEANMLREVGEWENVVVACGGGTPCFHNNMEYMKSRGKTVLLEATTECTLLRMRLAPGKRPLIAGKSDDELREYIRQTKAHREPFYSLANLKVSGEELENKSQIETTVDNLIPLLQS